MSASILRLASYSMDWISINYGGRDSAIPFPVLLPLPLSHWRSLFQLLCRGYRKSSASVLLFLLLFFLDIIILESVHCDSNPFLPSFSQPVQWTHMPFLIQSCQSLHPSSSHSHYLFGLLVCRCVTSESTQIIVRPQMRIFRTLFLINLLFVSLNSFEVVDLSIRLVFLYWWILMIILSFQSFIRL